jgi:hypothetical protein
VYSARAAARCRLDTGGAEHSVEGLGELRVAVVQQEPEPVGVLGEAHQQVAGLLCDPGAGRVRGHPDDVDLAGGDLDTVLVATR